MRLREPLARAGTTSPNAQVYLIDEVLEAFGIQGRKDTKGLARVFGKKRHVVFQLVDSSSGPSREPVAVIIWPETKAAFAWQEYLAQPAARAARSRGSPKKVKAAKRKR